MLWPFIKKPFHKILCLDFDGVIHSYSSGWKGPRIASDPPVPGAMQFIDKFLVQYCDTPDSICALAEPGTWELHIFSLRNRYWGGRKTIKRYLVKYGLDPRYLEVIKFPVKKSSAILTIDDRAMQFTGTFPTMETITTFKPWYKP